jgi:hypothetical protein
MQLFFSSIRTFYLLAAAIAALFVVGGCGGDKDSAGTGRGEIAVKTGSLSKAAFIKRADRLCKEAKSKFRREYVAFAKGSLATAEGGQAKVVHTMLVPNFEKLVSQIRSIGAPSSDEKEVAAFLNSLQRRLHELGKEPAKAFKTFSPLAAPVKLAKEYGLTGCAESLD